MAKWIKFVEQPSKGITKIFKVISKEGEMDLGTIKWFTRWRSYSFYPEANTVFETDCLNDIKTFIDDLTVEHKKSKVNESLRIEKFDEFFEGKSFKKNKFGLKNSKDRYRNINGIYYEHWTSNPSQFDQEKEEAKKLKLKTKIINNELFREVKKIT